MILELLKKAQHGGEVRSNFILGETEALGSLKSVCLELGPLPAERLSSPILLGSPPKAISLLGLVTPPSFWGPLL